MGESLSQWEAAEAGPAHSTPPVSPILSLARGDAPDASSPFQFDWCHLRVGGLTVAAVLSVLGVVVLLSGKCKCRSKARCRHPPPELSPLAGTGA
ncbi:FXYD domain-containing ion transport regulator 3 isoform X7 [Taeniopygia guttata]|uniref:FXYD domain-containing ion transport regulator 3 isoform X7 n=1 Tax=Taeniopygia guttata TaxID=59729 RepID=UPI0013F1BC4F|nr:FXYD domain-containing ion transport regulator 3 isoform X5 [Taeniopygia guttata]